MTTSTLRGNTGYAGGAINFVDGTLSVTESTIHGNYAGAGGAIFLSDGTLTLTNSTLSANQAAGVGGGLYAGPGATASLISNTIAFNVADENLDGAGTGGGIFQESGGSTSHCATRCWPATRKAPTFRSIWIRYASDCGGAVQSEGYALIEQPSCDELHAERAIRRGRPAARRAASPRRRRPDASAGSGQSGDRRGRPGGLRRCSRTTAADSTSAVWHGRRARAAISARWRSSKPRPRRRRRRHRPCRRRCPRRPAIASWCRWHSASGAGARGAERNQP